jgi:hypothetical protein
MPLSVNSCRATADTDTADISSCEWVNAVESEPIGRCLPIITFLALLFVFDVLTWDIIVTKNERMES